MNKIKLILNIFNISQEIIFNCKLPIGAVLISHVK